jgi:uncharacterized protein
MLIPLLRPDLILPVKQKIILGTVQLGMPYGINNSGGMPPEEEAFAILDCAYKSNIECLDSADGYGESLQVIGNYHRTRGIRFKIINKFRVDQTSISDKLIASLNILDVPRLYCYMYHHFADYQSKIIQPELSRLKEKGLIQKCGVSIYGVDQLELVGNDPEIDLIQLPVNLLDLTPRKKELLQQAHESGKEIHARSVYMQGLFLRNPETLEGNVKRLKPYLEQLIRNVNAYSHDIKSVALNYVLNLEYVDRVVIGVEKLDQLLENLQLINSNVKAETLDAIQIHPEDAFLLNPANWKP